MAETKKAKATVNEWTVRKVFKEAGYTTVLT